MSSLPVRVVCLLVALGMGTLAISGIDDALNYGGMTHLVAKRVALLVSWLLVTFMALVTRSTLRRSIPVIVLIGVLCFSVTVRYQVFPSWNVNKSENISEQTLATIEQIILTNSIGSGVEASESDGNGKYKWYVTTGSREWVPLVFALGLPLGVGCLLYFLVSRDPG